MIKDKTIKNVDLADGAVNSRAVANGSLATGDLSAATKTSLGQLWAVVNTDGTLARGRGATSADSLGVDGQYEVVFNRNVAGCAYAATLGDAAASTGAEGVVTVAPRDGNANAVFVQTFDVLTSTEADLPFHLVVFC
jgi:hypothetical protein